MKRGLPVAAAIAAACLLPTSALAGPAGRITRVRAATARAAAADAAGPLLAEIVGVEPAAPNFLEPAAIALGDFSLEWVGEPVADVRVSLEPESLQWVRVDDVLRFPRARFLVEAEGIEAGQVAAAGFETPLHAAGPRWRAAILVPLLAGERNPIEVVVRRGGTETAGVVRIRYRSPRDGGGPALVDTTCSSYGVRLEPVSLPVDSWIYVGCRMVTASAIDHRTSSLELRVFWEGVGDAVRVDGIETSSGGDGVWDLRLSAAPGRVDIAVDRADGGVGGGTIHYRVPERPTKAFLGLGVGPYYNVFDGAGRDDRAIAPVVTVYASYAISNLSRLVAFNATPLQLRGDARYTYSDTGLYLQRRTSDALDRRLSGNVFLGAHAVVFESRGMPTVRISAPQGAEFKVRDLGRVGCDLLVGGLINPGIGGRAYYNGWIRWGGARLFVEVNYIGWRETSAEGEEIDLRSVGLSIGGPLLRFL